MPDSTDPTGAAQAAAPTYISLPSRMPGFEQTGPCRESARLVNLGTRSEPRIREMPLLVVPGAPCGPAPVSCPRCGAPTRANGTTTHALAHLPMGGSWVRAEVEVPRRRCTACGATARAPEPFRAEGHMATAALVAFCEDLLALGRTLREVASSTGLCPQVVKEIDRARLERLYTDGAPGGPRSLSRPAAQSRLLGVDEFKLHDGHRYATLVVDLETGHVLWLARGKRKACVEGFFDHVGDAWMAGVEAVACDMNSDYEEAFRGRFPHVSVVFDRFHLVKNLNDKVVSEVRKDVQRGLEEAGDREGARRLKRTKYLLMASRATREAWESSGPGGPSEKPASLFSGEVRPRWRAGEESAARYRELMASNELLFAADLVKDAVELAYSLSDEAEMREVVAFAAALCRETGNAHFAWFARLLEGHMDGICAHARRPISSGRVEGTNNMIKTLRRRHYGLPDDEYFFLKVMDASHRKDRW